MAKQPKRIKAWTGDRDAARERPRRTERVQGGRATQHDEEPSPVERDGGERGSVIRGPRLPIRAQHERAACACHGTSVNNAFATRCGHVGSEAPTGPAGGSVRLAVRDPRQ